MKNVENVEKQENTVFNTFPNLNFKKFTFIVNLLAWIIENEYMLMWNPNV